MAFLADRELTEEIQMSNRRMEKYSPLVAIRQMPKINFLISQVGKDKDKLCSLVRHFCSYSAAEKGHKIGTAFPWRPADVHPKGAIGSFPPAVLLLGTKSSGFILRKWIKDLYKEVYTKIVSNV